MKKEERTLVKLAELNGRVYIYLGNSELEEEFVEQAIGEGLTYQDAVEIARRPCSNIMAINHDKTINHVGVNGRIAFQCNAVIGGEKLIKIDYEKYKNGEKKYRM